MFSGFLSKFTLTVYDSSENAKEGAPEKIVAKYQLKSYISTIMDKVMEKYFLKQTRVKFDFLVKEAIKELEIECKRISKKFDYTPTIEGVQNYIMHT